MALRAERRPGGGADAGEGRGDRSRQTWGFSRNCATTLPAGQALPPGSTRAGARPGEGRAQVAADLDLRNCATTLPPGLLPGFGTGGGTTQGRTGTGRGGRGFCEIAQRPSRRAAPPSARAGARPGEGRAQVAADVVFAKLRNDPPAGAGSSCFGTGGGTTRGRRGTGRGGRGFCEIAQQPLLPIGFRPGSLLADLGYIMMGVVPWKCCAGRVRKGAARRGPGRTFLRADPPPPWSASRPSPHGQGEQRC